LIPPHKGEGDDFEISDERGSEVAGIDDLTLEHRHRFALLQVERRAPHISVRPRLMSPVLDGCHATAKASFFSIRRARLDLHAEFFLNTTVPIDLRAEFLLYVPNALRPMH
jgi:hypothetical protein